MRKLLVFYIGLSLILFSCKKDKFNHQSEWLSPIMKTSMGLSDLQFDSLITTNADSTVDLVFTYSEKLDSLLSILDVPDSLSEVSFSLTQLVLEDRSFADTLTLREMYPPIILYNGQEVELEAQNITADNGTTLDVTEEFFETATFKEGFLDIKIDNDLPVEAELIEFELLNADDQSVVVSGTFNNIPAFGSDSQTFDLAGKTVNGVLEAKVKRIKTKASNGKVLIDITKGLILNLNVRDLKPLSATAIFPAQNLIEKKDETTYNFKGPEITVMRLKQGFVTMKVFSTIEEEIILEYIVPQSKHVQTKEQIKRTFVIPPSKNGVPSEIDQNFSIGNYEILYKGQDPNKAPFTNTFYSELNARIEYTGEVRSLALSDSIFVQFGLVDVVPELAIGGFGQNSYVFQDTQDLKPMKNIYGRLNLDDARLSVIFENAFGIEADFTINSIVGENTRSGKSVKLVSTDIGVPYRIERGINVTPSIRPFTKKVTFNKSNSNLKLFFENLPDRIRPSFKVLTQPDGHNNFTDFAFFDSYLQSSVELKVPLRMALEDLKIVKTTPFAIEDPAIQNIRSANFKMRVINSYPWEMDLYLEFLDDQGTVLTTLFGNQGGLIEPGFIDQNSGRVLEPKENILEVEVNPEKMRWVKEATQIRVSGTFNTPGNQRYQLYDFYNIDIKLIADFIYEN
ncbi:hypothetical protein GYB22_04005 [bacterium]|nr:hypothetical protein [bacterium]